MTNRSYNQFCGVAYALDVVGERWTLLLIRELMPGPRRFTDLLDGLPGISTNLLSGRLKWLEEKGVVVRNVLAPPAGSTVYELTALGQALEPSLIELGKWGSQFVPQTLGDDTLLHVGSYALTLKTFFQPERAVGIDESYALYIDDEILHVRIRDGEVHVHQGARADAVMTLHTDVLTYLGMLRGQLTVADALSGGHIQVEGDLAALERFLDLCGVPDQA